MKNISHSMLLAAAALAACCATASAAGADVPQPYQVITRMGVSTTTFGCGAGNAVACHYLILKSLCQERMLDDRTKERTCHYTEAAPPFKLLPGEKKTVGNLPADFLYAMKPNATPSVDEVLKSPAPH
jgi:predicted small secreted protein